MTLTRLSFSIPFCFILFVRLAAHNKANARRSKENLLTLNAAQIRGEGEHCWCVYAHRQKIFCNNGITNNKQIACERSGGTLTSVKISIPLPCVYALINFLGSSHWKSVIAICLSMLEMQSLRNDTYTYYRKQWGQCVNRRTKCGRVCGVVKLILNRFNGR